MSLIPGNLAPDFTLNSVDEEGMVESFSLNDKKGKFVVLMFDLVFFGHVTPAEFYPFLEPILEHLLSMDLDCIEYYKSFSFQIFAYLLLVT